MPTYVYVCPECQDNFEKVLLMSERTAPQECPKCHKPGTRVIVGASFMLKGDQWPGKSITLRGQMARKNARLDQKMAQRAPVAKLLPNVGGERTESWSDAKKLAASQGKETTSYEPLVAAEKG
jgi:putative FmdB family regulatory protein